MEGRIVAHQSVAHAVVEVRILMVEHGYRGGVGRVLVVRSGAGRRIEMATAGSGRSVRSVVCSGERPSSTGIGGGCRWNGTGHGCRLVAQFPLRGETLQVGHETHPHRILHIHSFDGDQVTGHLGRAFAEPYRVVVHGELVRVVGQRIQSCNGAMK